MCHEEYDQEAKCPRIFKCFHTLCTACVAQLITSNRKQCPFCGGNFKASSAKNVMINHVALELVKYILVQDFELSKGGEKGSASALKQRIKNLTADLKESTSHHLVNCQSIQKQMGKLVKEITDQQNILTREKRRIKSEVLPKLDLILLMNLRTTDLDKMNKKLRNQVKEVKKKSKHLQNVKGKLDKSITNNSKESSFMLEEAEDANTSMGEWLKNFKESISQVEFMLEAKKKEVQSTKEKMIMLLQVLSFSGFSKVDPAITSVSSPIHEETLCGHITNGTLQARSALVKFVLNQGRVIAVQHLERRKRWAKLSIADDNKLCLHHLNDGPVPTNVYVVEHSDVMMLVDPLSRLTFLDLGDDETTYGRLYIRLSPNTKAAVNFSLLCTGEMGPSYANTKVLQRANKFLDLECTCFGDYEKDDGTGGKALVHGLGMEEEEEEELYERPCFEGTVVGWWNVADEIASQFSIFMRNNPRKVFDTSFGMVEKGLHIMSKVRWDVLAGTGATIKDCGISISSS